MVNRWTMTCLLTMCLMGGVVVQAQAPVPRLFRDLVTTMAADAAPVVSTPQPTVEFVVTWERPDAAGDLMSAAPSSALDRLVLSETRPITARRIVHRRPELGPDQIVVVFRDAQGRERGWEIVTDPRILRAELPTASGELRGAVLYRSSAELTVVAPAGVDVASLVVYQPAWNGTDFLLTPVGVVAVAR